MKPWTLTLAGIATLLFASTVPAQSADMPAPTEAAPAATAPPSEQGQPSEAAADDAALPETASAEGGAPWSIDSGRAPEEAAVVDDAVLAGSEAENAVIAEVPASSELLQPVAAPDEAVQGEEILGAAADASAEDTLPAAPASDSAVPSGALAVDAGGNRGRIHVVARGDTLWDIAAAYLRTPWVWPSIWQENTGIEDPHRIYPGDHIWISETEMRRITPGEAAEMVAGAQGLADEPSVEEEMPLLSGLAAMEEPAPMPVAPARRVLQRTRIPGVADMSFVSEDQLSAATSVVSSGSPRTWLLEGDQVVLGLGEGETQVGARYDVFRDTVPVRDPDTGRILGHHIEILGWIEVSDVHGDSSSAVIRMSKSEMMRGDRVIEREEVPAEFALVEAPPDLDGRIIFTPMSRTQMTQLDYVYLDRGAVHGLEVGAEVEVFDGGRLAEDRVRGTTVRTPDRRVADLVIVSVQSSTSVGFVTHTARELNIGDAVRPRSEALAMR